MKIQQDIKCTDKLITDNYLIQNSVDLDWASSECYQILEQRVIIRSTSEELANKISTLMRAFPICKNNRLKNDLLFSFAQVSSANQNEIDSRYVAYRDDQRIGATTEWWQLFRFMEWQLDIFLSEAVTDYYLVHGGAVAKNGVGFILPAESGSGKSSLTLALLQRGFKYYTDDLVAINPATAELHPFPKPFSLKDPSLFPTLPDDPEIWLAPDPDKSPVLEMKAAHRNNRPVWYIHPEDVKAGSAGTNPVPIQFIIFPKYKASAEPKLELLSSSQALRLLIENSVNFQNLADGGLALLSRLVKNAKCYNLIVNGPQATAALVERLL